MTTIPSRIETLDQRDESARPRWPGRLRGMGADTVTLDVAPVQGQDSP